MLSIATIKKKLAELTQLAQAKQDADVFVSFDEMPEWLQDQHRAFDRELNAVQVSGGNAYEWLINNIERAPHYPLKPEKAHLAVTVGDTMHLSAGEAAQLQFRKMRGLYSLVRRAL